MERIVIEVADNTAKQWRMASSKFKNVISDKINKDISKVFESNKKENFMAYLDELSDKMEKRGLTEEILADILKEDE